jgi:hypothetical protein
MAPAMRPDWRKTLLDIILLAREAWYEELPSGRSEIEMAQKREERRLMVRSKDEELSWLRNSIEVPSDLVVTCAALQRLGATTVKPWRTIAQSTAYLRCACGCALTGTKIQEE